MRIVKRLNFLLTAIIIISFMIYFCSLFRFNKSNNNNHSLINENSHCNNAQNSQILIDINDRMLYIINSNKIVAQFPCAVGKPDTPSPLGSFKIIEKELWGNQFGGYWLGLDVAWGKFGIHGTLNPDSIGKNVSHGCIRLNNTDAQKVFSMVKLNTTVAIIEGEYGPFGNALKNIEYQSSGANVYAVQLKLAEFGYYKDEPNGIFDDYMLNCFNQYQLDHNIAETQYIAVWHLNLLGFIQTE